MPAAFGSILGGATTLIGTPPNLITTMMLTDLMNNAVTAAVMAPIALVVATEVGTNPGTFLMAVAIGASLAPS